MTATAKSLGGDPVVRSMAHELANLMQVVNGNLELLDMRIDDEQAKRYIANARLAAERLTELSHTLSLYGQRSPVSRRRA